MIWILRSLPGAGKSFWADKKVQELGGYDVEVFSADKYHIFDGKYCFDPKRAGYAHDCCYYDYTQFVINHSDDTDGPHHCIVDNTNTTLMELAPYVRLAQAYGKDYEIVYFHCDLKTSISRNIHNVPHNTILQMYNNLQNEIVPPYWKQTVIFPS